MQRKIYPLYQRTIKRTLLTIAITSILNPAMAAVQGTKFTDTNGNGIQDFGEQGNANEVIYVRNNDANELMTLYTDASGSYTFTPATDANYTMWTGVPWQWQLTTPDTGSQYSTYYTIDLTTDTDMEINFGIWDGTEPPPPPCGHLTVEAGPNVTADVGESITLKGAIQYKPCPDEVDSLKQIDLFRDFDDGEFATRRVDVVANSDVIEMTYEKQHVYIDPGKFQAILSAEVQDLSPEERQIRNDGAEEDDAEVTIRTYESDPCDTNIPTIWTIQSGNWNDPTIWSTGSVPTFESWAKINNGHVVTIPPITVPHQEAVNVKGLCIDSSATLQSAENSLGNPINNLAVEGATIHNLGTMRGQDGAPGKGPWDMPEDYQHATDGSGIYIRGYKFVNDGKVIAGNGGIDSTWASMPDYWPGDVFPSEGGDGGKVEIYPNIVINNGLIQSGDGGDADRCVGPNGTGRCVHGNAFGGRAGDLWIVPTEINDSMNTDTGIIQGGSGGDIEIMNIADSGEVGQGLSENDILLNLGTNDGEIIAGGPGSLIFADPDTFKMTRSVDDDSSPTTLTQSGQIGNADKIMIFGDMDWEMDLSGLSAGAIDAFEEIELAANIIDLRGAAPNALKAGTIVKIFANQVLLDDGVSLDNLIDAPNYVQQPMKLLYHAGWSGAKHYVEDAGKTITVSVLLVNTGPKQDTYTLSETHADNLAVSVLPETIFVNSSRRTELEFDVTFPTTPGDEGTVTLTATSTSDSSVKAIMNLRFSAKRIKPIAPIVGDHHASGVVLDKDYASMAGLTVFVGGHKAITDEQGQWQMEGLIEGTYPITLMSDNKVLTIQGVKDGELTCTITSDFNGCENVRIEPPLSAGMITGLQLSANMLSWNNLETQSIAGFNIWAANSDTSNCENNQGFIDIQQLNSEALSATTETFELNHVAQCYGVEVISLNGSRSMLITGVGVSGWYELEL